MKWIFSFSFFLKICWADFVPVKISYEGEKSLKAKVLKEILHQDYGIPLSFISIDKDKCVARRSYLHFCLDKEQNMIVLNFERDQFSRSFGPFQRKP